MSHFRIFEPRYLLAVVVMFGLAAFGPSCSGDDNGKGGDGGTGGGGGTIVLQEICGNALDDDDNGLVDCEDDACARTEECCPGCFTQCGERGQLACQGTLEGTITMICSPGGACERSGEVDANGTPRLGEVMVHSKMAEINPSMNYAAEQLLVISSDRPNTTTKATCEAIMGRQIDPKNPNDVNVVFEVAVAVQTKNDFVPAPAFGVPLPREGDKLLAVVRFFAARDINGNPVGDYVGEGCSEFPFIPEGDYTEENKGEPGRTLEVVIRLFCGGFLDRDCMEPKTCVMGLCRDTRCGTCGPGQTCREWNGAPECRRTCNPDAPNCPNLHYCDTTPGEPAACVPVEE